MTIKKNIVSEKLTPWMENASNKQMANKHLQHQLKKLRRISSIDQKPVVIDLSKKS